MSLLVIIPLGFCGLMIMNVIVLYTDAALNVHCLYLVSPCFLFFLYESILFGNSKNLGEFSFVFLYFSRTVARDE